MCKNNVNGNLFYNPVSPLLKPVVENITPTANLFLSPCVLKVIQQALHRQPNTAAQYLQQMYAAQQQHLMLQTAALQQQHLSNAQLQNLAAVQQVSSGDVGNC